MHPPESHAVLLERGVVGEHLEVRCHGAGRVDRLVDVVHQRERDLVGLEADGQVQPALAADQDVPAAQPPEVHVPQPRGVPAVGSLRVDREQDRGGRRRHHVERLKPARRVLGEQQPDVDAAAVHLRVPPGHRGNRAQFAEGLRDVHAERLGDRERDDRVGAVGPAGQREVERGGPAGRVDHLVVVEQPAHRRPPQPAFLAGPVVTVALQVSAAVRAAPGVFPPPLARGHPGGLASRARRPGDQRVVGVGHHPAVRSVLERLPPAAGEQPDLGRAVHLVAAQVQQDDHRGPGRLDHRRDVLLVGLEDRDPGVGGAAERGREPGLHVRAVDVRGDLAAQRGQRGGDELRGRRLAVGAGDEDDLAPRGQQGQQVGGQAQADDAADDGAVALPGEAGNGGGRAAHGGRDPGPDRQPEGLLGVVIHRGADAIRSPASGGRASARQRVTGPLSVADEVEHVGASMPSMPQRARSRAV